MDQAQLVKAFTATVQASLHGLQSLEPVLRRESEALTGRDPELLSQAVQDKLFQLQALEPSVKARDRLLATAGLDEGLDGGNRLVEMLDDADLARDWQELRALAQAVAELNDVNAQLASQGQRATRTALGILTNRPSRDDTYTSLRRKPGAAARHTLGKV